MNSKSKYFHEVPTGSIGDAVVILDIDGTLTCGCSEEVSEDVHSVIQGLKKNNTLHAFSNSFDQRRSRGIAKKIDVPYIDAPNKKPYWSIKKYVHTENKKIVVIGDKYLTDGLLAQFNGVEHVRVCRYVCDDDSIADKFVCALDDAVFAIARLLRLTRHN